MRNSGRLLLLCLVSTLFTLSATLNADDWVYSVRPGDSIWTICARYVSEPLCWRKLRDHNAVKKPRALPPGSTISIPVGWLKEKPTPVTTLNVNGVANFRTTKNKLERTLEAGQLLYMGDVIITKGGSATVAFADGSIMVIEAESTVHFDQLSRNAGTGMVDTITRIEKGGTTSKATRRAKDVNNRFRIQTPAGVAAVRGTTFRVNYQDNSMRSEVLEGRIEVAAAGSSEEVSEGFGNVTEEGKPPSKPRKLLDAPSYINPPTSAVPVPFDISWEAVVGANEYTLAVYSSDKKQSLLHQFSSKETTKKVGILDDGAYFLVVRAVDSVGLSGQDTGVTLSVLTPLLIPALADYQISKSAGETHTITWPNVPNAVAYRIQTSAEIEFTDILSDQETSVAAIDLPNDQRIYVRAQAIYANGKRSAFSDITAVDPQSAFNWLNLIHVILLLSLGLL